MAWRRSHYAAAAVLAAGALTWATRAAWSGRRPLTAAPIQVASAYEEFADTLGARETLSDVLRRGGIVGRAYAGFLRAAQGLEVRRLRPGLVFHFRRVRGDSIADRVMVRPGADRRVRLLRRGADSGWVEQDEVIAWTLDTARAVGAIATSLYDALDGAIADTALPAAERVALAWDIADVYDWEVDFTRDVHPGDRFEVVYERLVSPDGERRVRGVLATRVNTGRTANLAFRFALDSAHAGFYDDQGRSLKRAFLRAPLQFRRISSGFGNRYHPILHRFRHHDGIDFEAAYGTPVRATADGMVSRISYEADGYGNYLELRHANGIRTRYGHLSKYAAGLHVGQRVTQSETIGYVGSTGLSTGPHLHYELIVNGQATNPRRKDAAGAGQPVPAGRRAAYDHERALLAALLDPVRSLASDGTAKVD
ncbi:MAG TPA: M23 family metallopeptidase [Gemmatimonadales bacterium]